jgi:ribonuclease BN (tRNA processing enzyme)
MGAVRLIPLGVGEAFTSRYYTSSLALGVDDEWLLIDCSHPVRKMLREASLTAGLSRIVDLDCVSAAAISHLHADHCCGLEDLGYYSFFALGRRARILMHPDASARLWNGLLAAGMETVQTNPGALPVRKQLSDYFELINLDTAKPVHCGPFSIECRRTIHGVPTFAFRITASGRVLGYSADTAYDPGLIEWLSAADLIVHEATNLTHTGVHTPVEKLVALPQALRSKLRLTHYPDDFDVDSSVIEPLREGQPIEV